MRGHQDQFATSAHAHLRVTTTTASGKPSTTGKEQLVGTAIALGWVFAVAAILYGAELGLAYAGVPARVVADTTNTIGLVLALSVLGELVFVLAQLVEHTRDRLVVRFPAQARETSDAPPRRVGPDTAERRRLSGAGAGRRCGGDCLRHHQLHEPCGDYHRSTGTASQHHDGGAAHDAHRRCGAEQ